MRIGWKAYFMAQAKVAALRSGCNSRPTGCVIVRNKRVLAGGYNGTVSGRPQCTDRGPEYCYRREVGGPEEDKYNVCPSIHAEANAIAQAALLGISLNGSEAYCTLQPCFVCLKLLKQVGVVKVYYETSYESKDRARDTVWGDFNSVDMIGERVVLTDAERNAVMETLGQPTSARRLGVG